MTTFAPRRINILRINFRKS